MNASPTWGYTRSRGGLNSLGHDVARNTINAILKGHGIEPAPERGTNTPSKTFLAAHWDGLVAADFFTVEVLTMGGLVRYVVFFVVKLKTRAVEVAGITNQIAPRTTSIGTGPVTCRARLGGLLKFYYREPRSPMGRGFAHNECPPSGGTAL
jgi:hypothetical protein